MVRELTSLVYQSGYVSSNNEYCMYLFVVCCRVKS